VRAKEWAVPILEIRGSPRQMGQQQGEGARPEILRALAGYRETIPKVLSMTWEVAQREARKFLPYGEETFPQFVEELRGMAEGAGVPFEEVWTLNCYEGLTESRQQVWGCWVLPSATPQANGHVLIAHNDDWDSVDTENVYLVRGKPDQGPDLGIPTGRFWSTSVTRGIGWPSIRCTPPMAVAPHPLRGRCSKPGSQSGHRAVPKSRRRVRLPAGRP
jgi:hypothetical protein